MSKALADKTPRAALAAINLAPSPLSLPDLCIEILNVETDRDGDGDMHLIVNYAFTNPTAEDVEYLDIRAIILNATGQPIVESTYIEEVSIGAGEQATREASFRFDAPLLEPHPDQAHVVITVTACNFGQCKLGDIAIPEEPLRLVAVPPITIDGVLQLVSGSLWMSAPNDDKHCLVEVICLVQNLTAQHLPEVKLLAEIVDKKGREVTDGGAYEEVRPGAIVPLRGIGCEKENRFKGAKVELAIRAYWPVASGVGQQRVELMV